MITSAKTNERVATGVKILPIARIVELTFLDMSAYEEINENTDQFVRTAIDLRLKQDKDLLTKYIATKNNISEEKANKLSNYIMKYMISNDSESIDKIADLMDTVREMSK